MTVKQGKVYKIKGGLTVKEGYEGKKVKVVNIDGTIKAVLLKDINVNEQTKVKKGTILHFLHADALM